MTLVKSGQSEGANMLCGGTRVGHKGYFFNPTVFSDVKDGMTIAKQEVTTFLCFGSFKKCCIKKKNLMY